MISVRRHDADESVLAVCRQEGHQWRLLIVRENGGSPTVLGTVFGDAQEASAALKEHAVGRILMAMPSWAYLVRTIRLPRGSDQQLMSALRLEAETRLLGSAPDHRRALTILGGSSDHPIGLVCSWPDSLHPETVPMPSGSVLDVTWAPDVAALAAATDGQSALAATFDPETGALAVVVPTPSGPVFRATREPLEEGADWSQGVAAVVRETLLGEGLDPADVERIAIEAAATAADSSSPLILPDGATERLKRNISGVDDELLGGPTAGWRVLLGIWQASRGDLAPLTTLRDHKLKERPNLLSSIKGKLATPRIAAGVVALCVILMVLTPLAASGIRLLLVESKIDDIRSLETSVRRTQNLIQVYRTLDDEAWSMTKLLGDLANCMPETLEAVTFVLAHGDPVSIEGISKTEGSGDGSEAVLAFAHRLRETGLFENVEPSFSPSDGRGIRDFKITADVKNQARPILFSDEEDYALRSYSERRWGPVDADGYLLDGAPPASMNEPPAGDINASESSDLADARGSDEDRRRSGSRSVENTPNARGAPRSRSEGRGEPLRIPEHVTAEEVRVMNRSEALTRLSEVAKVKNMPGIDEDVLDLLQNDFDLLMERVRETAE